MEEVEKQEGDAGAGDNAVADTPEDTRYKELQRKVSKLQQENRRLSRQSLAQETTASEVKILSKGISDLVGALKGAGMGDEGIERVQQSVETGRRSVTQASNHLGQIDEMLSDAEADITEERFGKAREKWQKGDFAGAEHEVEKVVGKGPVDPKVLDELVDAKVQAALRGGARKVDTSGPTGSKGTFNMAAFKNMSPHERLKHVGALKEHLQKGQKEL